MNTSPLLDYYLSLGYGKNGNSSFNYFTSPEEEVNILYNGVGLLDLSSEGILELRGKDVLDFLNRISTNSVKDLPKEAIVDTIFTNEKGRIIDSTSIMNFDDLQVLLSSSVHKEKLLSWLKKYVIMDDVKVLDVQGKYIFFKLLGPQADSYLSYISGNIINNIQPNKFRVINTEGIMFFLCKRVDLAGQVSYSILADNKNGRILVNYMKENQGPYDFGFIGSEAYNSYRIDKGIPVAPNEINDKYNPHEIKMLDKVSFTKGCYIGQEVIARLDTYSKVQKYLSGVILDQDLKVNEPIALLDQENNEVGTLTSAAYSYKCKKYFGLAYIRKAFVDEGRVLSAVVNAKKIKATVHNLPFKK